MEILDIIGEINNALPWLYRGWAFLLSRKYREKCLREWKTKNLFSVVIDIVLSLATMLAEGVLAYFLYVELTA